MNATYARLLNITRNGDHAFYSNGVAVPSAAAYIGTFRLFWTGTLADEYERSTIYDSIVALPITWLVSCVIRPPQKAGRIRDLPGSES